MNFDFPYRARFDLFEIFGLCDLYFGARTSCKARIMHRQKRGIEYRFGRRIGRFDDDMRPRRAAGVQPRIIAARIAESELDVVFCRFPDEDRRPIGGIERLKRLVLCLGMRFRRRRRAAGFGHIVLNAKHVESG